ncbi:hypothetical protein FB45DRAFT_889903 [Roridomyces roridus]|uniref:Uncharacterized protein n=1 Tax=Roridomyces roridus TaxID=1738132 RepID=A0AAD7CKP4_9AGAR|nr:hypothetical protein FB45DRAFT_889903 [Roridomyces roridus]
MLPDEIISKIITPGLKVPEELFSDTSPVSPFSTYTLSPSAYLVVCKDWLRVATPLLYNVVVLRSTAQAAALALALKDTPELGRFIKKLRVEGGYGPPMHAILKCSPNVTDLFLSFSIWPSDTNGLCQGLPLINPHRLILVDNCESRESRPRKNKDEDALRKAVRECIPLWTNLRICYYPYSSDIVDMAPYLPRATKLSQALAASHVHTVILYSEFSFIPAFIRTLYDIPSLRVLQFEQPITIITSPSISLIKEDPRLRKLAKYTVRDSYQEPVVSSEPDITPSWDPRFTPMASASEQARETVWQRMLFFAMYAEEARSPSFSRRPSASRPSPVPILCVSKDFHRLALPHLYESVELTPRNAAKFRERLDKEPTLGSFIRRIFTTSEVTVQTTTTSIPGQDIRDAVLTAFRSACNLEVFSPVPQCPRQHVSSEAFELLTKTAAPSLQRLTSISASMFEPFSALRTLDIAELDIKAGRMASPSHALKSLHNLEIEVDSYSSVILAVFEDMRLESLRSLRFKYRSKAASSLVEVHGAKLLHLMMDQINDFPALDMCPNLVDIELTGDWNLAQFDPSNPHNSLTKIVASNLPKNMDEDDFKQEMLPALREIQIKTLDWPTNERDIRRSNVVPFVEYLLKKNIKLTSRDGKAWPPRVQLKTARGRKKA